MEDRSTTVASLAHTLHQQLNDLSAKVCPSNQSRIFPPPPPSTEPLRHAHALNEHLRLMTSSCIPECEAIPWENVPDGRSVCVHFLDGIPVNSRFGAHRVIQRQHSRSTRYDSSTLWLLLQSEKKSYRDYDQSTKSKKKSKKKTK